MDQPDKICWIAVDWGTSNLRLWAMDQNNAVLDRRESGQGLNKIGDGGFEAVLTELVSGWLPEGNAKMPVVICGMAGAKQGWCEAPYCAVPVRPDELAAGAVSPSVDHAMLSVFILPGAKQVEDPDVMRGEETQLVGFMADMPGYDGWICLPGTHSKWARVQNGAILSFRTYMSGEVYGVLAQNSILRHSMADDWNAGFFRDAILLAADQPGDFLHRLFGIRAAGLVGNKTLPGGPAALSGYVIGAEIADIAPRLTPGSAIAIIGDGKLAALYETALACHGHRARLINAETVTLGGLCRAYTVLAASSSPDF
ncbi:MAG: 2-dehydro-3-deoxygalactonokinase [Pseudomonadota bacterium]